MLRKAFALRLLQPSAAIVPKDDDVLRILVGRPRLDAEYSISPHIINTDARKAVTGMAPPQNIHRFDQLFQVEGGPRARTSELLRFLLPVELDGLAGDSRHSVFVEFAPVTESRIDPPNELRAGRDGCEVVRIVGARHECCSAGG